tara:strand:- start:112 stop:327 length:216 start_codon:yes stop_codon:yes gene_type:complete
MGLFIDFLKNYFERISLIYHVVLLTFLLWLMYLKREEQKINKNIIRVLGIYVIFYGYIMFHHGPKLINKEY